MANHIIQQPCKIPRRVPGAVAVAAALVAVILLAINALYNTAAAENDSDSADGSTNAGNAVEPAQDDDPTDDADGVREADSQGSDARASEREVEGTGDERQAEALDDKDDYVLVTEAEVWSNFHRTCLSPESMRLAKEVQGMRSLLPSELLKGAYRYNLFRENASDDAFLVSERFSRDKHRDGLSAMVESIITSTSESVVLAKIYRPLESKYFSGTMDDSHALRVGEVLAQVVRDALANDRGLRPSAMNACKTFLLSSPLSGVI